jgi:vacuolar iron transporter family protein
MNYDKKLARSIVLDELFELTLYEMLRKRATGAVAEVLDDLIESEAAHRDFWEKFFGIRKEQIGFLRTTKLWILLFFCRIFGDAGVRIVLEAVEVYGIRKYLLVWKEYKNDPLGDAVGGVLKDEFKHEEETIKKITGARMRPERIRDIFLGFNDGLVEVIGAVSGFFAAFQSASSVLVAGFTVAIAGAISMAAGAYSAMGSEKEIEKTREEKRKFLDGSSSSTDGIYPLNSAFVVGVSYFSGALIPLLPVFFGATNIFISILISGIMIIIMSTILAFISGMEIRKRIIINLVIISIAVSVTYVIGLFAREVFGVNV